MPDCPYCYHNRHVRLLDADLLYHYRCDVDDLHLNFDVHDLGLDYSDNINKLTQRYMCAKRNIDTSILCLL
ncbi:unnamed protein product [Rotaria sordida]|uniref:Uncharacterized protein n=2 Tax=Rotaria sordida TaxID=392033 RepID=A0A819IJV2_9BILA|nr:unnamed protein product [Rotaria sordida]